MFSDCVRKRFRVVVLYFENCNFGSARIEIWATLTGEIEPNERLSLVKVYANELAVGRVHKEYETCIALFLRKGTN